MKRRSEKVKGSALFLTLILSLIGLMLISGLFMAYYRMLKVIFPIRIYSNIREAASGTVMLLASFVDKGDFSGIDQDDCPIGTKEVNGTSADLCCQAEIKFKLVGYTEVFIANTTVCLLARSNLPGDRADPVTGGGNKYFYSITTTAFGPQGTSSYVESLYVR
jgi:hypothetical protein